MAARIRLGPHLPMVMTSPTAFQSARYNGPYATQLFERIELYQYVMKIHQPRCQIGKMQHTR